jgi:DNA (cytosine-5)-methyltransferase 1
MGYTSIEICAGAGGQALGLEKAGFEHVALVEYEKDYCDCLRRNRPNWNVQCMDVRTFDGRPYKGTVDLLAGGVPCPPFSVAGKQLGADDERDLFPQMLRLVGEIGPKAVMIENVRGFLSKHFDSYRKAILSRLNQLGYNVHISLLNASDYGVPQLRPRVVIVGIRTDIFDVFSFPPPQPNHANNVGRALIDLMAANGWEGADKWQETAGKVAPTLVGGSKKHGGPDLGPTRSREAWAEMGIDGRGIANEAPAPGFVGMPRLTPRMLARLQGFPDEWDFGSRKTIACRMIGNAFPPPVAAKVGQRIKHVLDYASIDSRGPQEIPLRAVI